MKSRTLVTQHFNSFRARKTKDFYHLKNFLAPFSAISRSKFLILIFLLMNLFLFEKAWTQDCGNSVDFAYEFGDETISSELNITGQNIRISGTVILHNNVVFNDCQIRMEPKPTLFIDGS